MFKAELQPEGYMAVREKVNGSENRWDQCQFDMVKVLVSELNELVETIRDGDDVERVQAWGELEYRLKGCHEDLFGGFGGLRDFERFDWDGLDQMIKETPLTMWRKRRAQGERAFRSREGAARVARDHIAKIEGKVGRMARYMIPTGGVVDVFNKIHEGKYILPFHLEGLATWEDATEYQHWVEELTGLIDEWYCELVGDTDRDM